MVRSIMARCRIGCQIAILALLGLIGMAAVAGVNLWGTRTIADSNGMVMAARDASDLDAQLQISMLQARRHEKDFLLRHDEKYVASHAEAMTAAGKAIDGLRAHAIGQADMLAKVEAVRSDMGRYQASFNELVKTSRLIGLNEDLGLQGELRGRVNAVEAVLQPLDAAKLQISMLTMRRHEKNFITRLDPKWGGYVKAELPVFLAALEAVALPPATRDEILADMTAYQNIFARFMSGTLAGLSSEKTLNAVYAEIEPDLVALDVQFNVAERAASQEGDRISAVTRQLVLVTLGISLLVIMGLSWLVGRGIARPVVAVTRSMEALVNGDLSVDLPQDRRSDEIGTMVRTVRAFRDSLVEAARLREAQVAERQQFEKDKEAAMIGMAVQIEQGAGSSVQQIGDRTAVMITIAEEMGNLAGRTGGSARNAADAAEQALGTAQAVASASEQLAASIREISGQISHSAIIVSEAVQAGNETRITIGALNERVGLIGAVADIIGDIAAKTNLLALNATIEAARAGDAGKGFAVVASEVKQLASQTRRSTEEITSHISQIRVATNAAVSAVDRIETTIGEINGISSSIAAAVEQQGAATAEIARNVTETASAVNRMSGMNADVAREAEQAGRYAGEVLENTRALDGSVGDLKQTMVRIVRSSTMEVNRRSSPRYVVNLPCRVEMAGRSKLSTHLADISDGGAKVMGLSDVSVGGRGTLRLDGFAAVLPFHTLEVTEGFARVAFDLTEEARMTLFAFLANADFPMAA